MGGSLRRNNSNFEVEPRQNSHFQVLRVGIEEEFGDWDEDILIFEWSDCDSWLDVEVFGWDWNGGWTKAQIEGEVPGSACVGEEYRGGAIPYLASLFLYWCDLRFYSKE